MPLWVTGGFFSHQAVGKAVLMEQLTAKATKAEHWSLKVNNFLLEFMYTK